MSENTPLVGARISFLNSTYDEVMETDQQGRFSGAVKEASTVLIVPKYNSDNSFTVKYIEVTVHDNLSFDTIRLESPLKFIFHALDSTTNDIELKWKKYQDENFSYYSIHVFDSITSGSWKSIWTSASVIDTSAIVNLSPFKNNRVQLRIHSEFGEVMGSVPIFVKTSNINLLSHGGFEKDSALIYWKRTNAPIFIDSSTSYEGIACLLMKTTYDTAAAGLYGQTGAEYKGVKLEKNRSYELTFSYKIDGLGSAFKDGVWVVFENYYPKIWFYEKMSLEGIPYVDVGKKTYRYTSANWSRNSIVFSTVEEMNSFSFTILAEIENVWIDDVVLKIKE